MSVVNTLHRELFAGVREGITEARQEAPVLAKVAGLRDPNCRAMNEGVYLRPMPYPILGQTGITPAGEVVHVSVNNNIPLWVERMMRVYNRGSDWAKKTVYKISKRTTKHELAHALSSRVARGERHNHDTVAVMESVTTYAAHKAARRLGKHAEAEEIRATNPYPRAWRLGEVADWAPYSSPSGEGYAAFMKDAQKEPFYKPLWRLTKAAATRKAREIFVAHPRYAFAYAKRCP